MPQMATDDPPLSPILLDSVVLPPDQQFGAWAAHSRLTRLLPLRTGGFLAQGSFWTLGPVHIAQVVLDPFVSDRDQAMLTMAAADCVTLVELREGTVHLEGEAGSCTCVAPGMFLRDYAQRSRATSSRIDCVVVYFARDFLEETTGPQLWQGCIPPSAEAEILAQTLSALVERLPRLSAAHAMNHARVLRDLVLTAWPIGADVVASAAGGRWEACRAYLAARPHGQVCVAAMAEELGISRSVLYRLFRQHGGVAAYDRQRRLRLVYRALSNPDDTRTVKRIGVDHGFTDKSYLTRAFRKAFGCTPMEVRRQRSAGPQQAALAGPAEEIRQAVELLA